MKSYFGTHWLIRIWRNHMDVSNKGYITRKDLINIARKIEYQGNVAAAWRCLTGEDRESGKMFARDLAAQDVKLMSAFRKAVTHNFRDPIAAWLSMDQDFSGNCDSGEFGTFCHKFRLPDRTVNCLFNSVNS